MKRLLLLLVFLPYFLFSQTPQGVGYQGVATDAAGFELINQSISIRASVISGSAKGILFNYLYANYPTDLSFNYTVPAGKIMKITDVNYYNVSSANPTLINGQLWHNSAELPSLLSEVTQIEIQYDYAGDGISLQYILFDN